MIHILYTQYVLYGVFLKRKKKKNALECTPEPFFVTCHYYWRMPIVIFTLNFSHSMLWILSSISIIIFGLNLSFINCQLLKLILSVIKFKYFRYCLYFHVLWISLYLYLQENIENKIYVEQVFVGIHDISSQT